MWLTNSQEMAKDKIAYVCSNCGQESQKWMGRCPNCGQWNTFREIRVAADTGSSAAHSAAMALNNYRMAHVPQVVSFTAPTGSGKRRAIGT